MYRNVDFLGIGEPRSGTTWVWNVLKLHPQIWMPPIKELHYFDRSPKYHSISILTEDRLVNRILGREIHNHRFRKTLLNRLKKTISNPQLWKNLGWECKYFLSTYHDKWYLSLFDTKQEAVKGELTPTYSILSEEDVYHIHTLLPHLKIIYILRNPIDRAWSHLRFTKSTKRRFDYHNIDYLIQVIERSYRPNLLNDYTGTIQKWSSCFSKDQVLISFYDDIILQPQKIIYDIFNFLNVDTITIPNEILFSRINASREEEIPEAVKRYLAHKYFPEVKKLVPLVGRYSEAWLREIETILN